MAAEIRALDLFAREERIIAEVERGNVPTWMRELERVEIRRKIEGHEHRIAFWVTPDYFAIGSDTDFLRVPLTPWAAARIAELAKASLPTPRMVNAIWGAASMRLAPIRIPPDEFMTTVDQFERHDALVFSQRMLYNAPPGTFVAGTKVDLVDPIGEDASSGGAIYGWHNRDGRAVQPYFELPEGSRPTFSQGVRLVARTVVVDGTQRDLGEVLSNPALAPLLAE